MPASISSTFLIEYHQSPGTPGTFTIANPGRTFRIMAIWCTGLNLSVITVRKNTGAGAVIGTCTLATGDLNDFPAALNIANIILTATDNLHVTVATANATEVKVLCVADEAQVLTVT